MTRDTLTRSAPHFAFSVLALAACTGSSHDSPLEHDSQLEADTASSTQAEDFFLEAIGSPEAVFTSEQLMPHFDALQPIGIDAMLGTWKGGKFDGGEPDPINWWGKKVVSADEVLPMLCQRQDGTVYSWELLGLASMTHVEFRGVTSASLVYDNGFMQDYFRRVAEDVVVGYSPIGYGDKKDLFFHLTRVPDVGIDE